MIICVSGQKQNGKDTIADRIQVLLDKEYWQRTAFAEALKNIYCDNFNKTREFIEEWKTNKECPPGMEKNVRDSLVFIGDGYRQIMPNIWIDKTFNFIEKNPANYIISDGRYLNELRAVRKSGGLNILVWRKDWENDDNTKGEQELKLMIDWCRDTGQEGRIEQFMPYFGIKSPPQGYELFDIFVRNEGTLEELHEKIDTWLLKAVKRTL